MSLRLCHLLLLLSLFCLFSLACPPSLSLKNDFFHSSELLVQLCGLGDYSSEPKTEAGLASFGLISVSLMEGLTGAASWVPLSGSITMVRTQDPTYK
jgi:hypothetical protein